MKKGLWKIKIWEDLITLVYGDFAFIDFEKKDIDDLIELLKKFKESGRIK